MTSESIRFLNRADVAACLSKMDAAEVVAQTLRDHTSGRTELPPEGYLSWSNSAGAYSRAIAMLGAVPDGAAMAYGMKLINASVGNPGRGLERAGGLSFAFDPETARPAVVAEAGLLSAVRTATYTVVSLRELGPESFDTVSLIGTGTLARVHLEAIADAFPAVRRAVVFDLDPARAAAFRDDFAARRPELTVTVADSARHAAGAAPVLITVTTSNDPYIPASWLAGGSFVAHVSLDDLTGEAFRGAEAVFVDDLELIRDNPRRIMGRLLQEGVLTGGDGSLGEVLTGRRPARRPGSGYVISNPFGMAVLDVALIHAVAQVARETGAGQLLDLL
ncbi:ornithine cyclodeaminase [Actinoplanes sp. SE50]|uniref:ornithine cyclodeaminase family protein n=1 Tax=unclassified Actinoplanes TaxID=2626549 RepID=UPI00023EC3D5|nr:MULTISPECIES: ornithine cyclodeaminase family protein [unclassified Actinoplanes]AEV81898.1 ornithine cyclodeaminase [Actinoplanes sp. SE50/110]ATO80299.1 ornithine cyclodeaminase [Actinoplanes sp. SE50]SLL97704.1 ornithine cyclodeaminase [Actinoplanes sp. SE50/110]